jgi:hypothetical protein
VEYFFVFDYLKESINKEMDDKIESGECGAHLITIAVKKDAISTTHWIRKNKEFFLNGVYYDVAQITETASDFVFLCMNDGKEEALFEHFFDFFEHSPKSKQPRKREPVLNPLYFTDRKACYSYRPYISIVQTSVFSNHYTKVYMEIKYPPPRVV